MSIDTGRVVFRIREVENGTPLCGVLLRDNPNGIDLHVGEGRGSEGASSVTKFHFFQDIVANNGGVVPGRN